ncbi:MAG TPA: hypothetical protein VF721_23280 [Pyrinomonadaceae bacterium]|jgi:hypothetical protein
MLSVLGLIFIIVAPIFIYRTAKECGRNAAGWALTAFALGFVIQFIIPIVLGILLALFLVASGHSPAEIQQAASSPAVVIDLTCLVASIAAVILIMRHVSKFPEEESLAPPPPPPAPTEF